MARFAEIDAMASDASGDLLGEAPDGGEYGNIIVLGAAPQQGVPDGPADQKGVLRPGEFPQPVKWHHVCRFRSRGLMFLSMFGE
jgi:hypothetical protein